MVLESQYMLKMSSSGSNTGVQMLPPLVNCIVNDALLHVSPHVNQTSLQVVHILDFCLVDTLLHYAPDFVVSAVWRPQIWQDKRRCLTFQKTDHLTRPVCRRTILLTDEELTGHLTYGWYQRL